MSSFASGRLLAVGQHAKRSVLIAATIALPLTASLATPVGAAAPPTRPATDTFAGNATTNTPGMGPIVFAGPPTFLSDGTMKVPYMYQAQGDATGDVRGAFAYEEHGTLYINPAVMALVGSEFTSGVFTLTPDKKGSTPIVIADTSPTTYQHGAETAQVSDVGKAMAVVNQVLSSKGDATKVTKGALSYGYFTFTDSYGTFKGIATTDFSQFAIRITFDAPANDK